MTRAYGPRDVAAAAELDAADARAVAAETKARQLEAQALAFRDRALAAEATVARVEARLAEYERMCDPAPHTSERAFVERLRKALRGES